MPKPDLLSEKITTLLSHKHLLTASELLQQLEKQGDTYNKTSVYRCLDKLLDAGTVCRYDFAKGEASYELQDSHHDHVICTSCGKIAAVACRFGKQTRIPGFSVDHHHLTFFGTCSECKG